MPFTPKKGEGVLYPKRKGLTWGFRKVMAGVESDLEEGRYIPGEANPPSRGEKRRLLAFSSSARQYKVGKKFLLSTSIKRKF